MASRTDKRQRASERTTRKALAAKRIPFHGVIVSKQDVIAHRYLAVRGLEFSRSVAAVQLQKGGES